MRFALLATAAFVVGAAPALALAKPAVPTIAQLSAFPRLSGVSVSPDGKHLIALEGRGEDRVILVFRTDALDQAPTVIGSTQMKIQGASFAKNDMLAVTLWQPFDFRLEGVTKTFVNKLFLTDLEGKNWKEPLALPRARSNAEELEQSVTSPTVLSRLPNDPDHIIVVNNVGANAGDVYRVNVRTSRAERIQRSEEGVSGYQVDRLGDLRARLRSDTDGKGSFVAAELRDASSGWSEHFRSYTKDRDRIEVVGFAEDPNIALVRSNVGADRSEIYEYDVAQRKKLETLFRHKFFDATGAVTFAFSGSAVAKPGEVVGLTYDGPRQNDVQWVAPQFVAIDKAVRSALKLDKTPTTFADTATGETATANYESAGTYEITSYTPDLKTIVLTVDGPNRFPSTYLLRNGELSLLGKTFPDMDSAALGTTSLIYYKARDGRTVPGFLTRPNVELCGSGPWRSVVHPHGGPWARDNMRFDGSMWVPLMASRCIAVLQPQFRGSDGWGRSLWKAGDAEWGQKMQDDKDDGAQWMIDQKVAIPGRIAMFGFSYGGYSAMVAAIRPNGIYKCAIAGAGVSDYKKITRNLFTNPFFRDAQKPTISGLNPVDRAENISIPIMVYQGERDQTVPVEQSEMYVARAKRSTQKVEYHLLADYAHGPAWTRAIFANQLTLIDDYFSKGCGGSGL